MWMRRLFEAVKGVEKAIQQNTESIHASKEREWNGEPVREAAKRIIAFEKKTVTDTKEENDRQHRTQISIRNWTAGAVLAACIYAAIAACQLRGIQEANRISHDALVATQRAYVTVTGLNIRQSTFNPKLVSYIVSPIVVNSGNTPTKNLWWTAVWGTPPTDVANEPTEEDLTGENHNYGTLGARQEIRDLIEQPIPTEQAAILRQSYARKHIPIYGALVYEDGISDPPILHVRRYCYSLYVNPYFTPPNGFSYTTCGRRSNCEDEECDEATQQQMKVIRATKRN
jgi:hypothetical protein